MESEILERGDDPSLYPILNSKPELFADLRFIWEGFMILTASRQVGMSSPQPIQFSEIKAYCEFAELRDQEDREAFVHHIQKMDEVFQADFRARNPSTPTKGKMGGGS